MTYYPEIEVRIRETLRSFSDMEFFMLIAEADLKMLILLIDSLREENTDLAKRLNDIMEIAS